MSFNTSAPWHRKSFDRFVSETLPKLLARRMPLVGYEVEPVGEFTCRVRLGVKAASGVIEVEYADVPQPNEEGVFDVEGRRLVVLPTASVSELDVAEMKCVGEQLYDAIEERLGESPRDLPWDESLVRAWLPLTDWITRFLTDSATSQPRSERNWLDRCTQLRRITVLDRTEVVTPGQFGRTCPFETPEGVNIGRILHVAVGAEISEGELVIVDDCPQAALGVTASMVPFIEHTDSNRLLMGCNMMRQWLVPTQIEPAIVQTGNEVDAPDFWCGKNLLTAFVSWGADTYEDAIVISESAAKRLAATEPVEIGDKLSNRHGTKGVVGRILPDDEMPQLEDGTPVEIIFSFMGMHNRLNFGQVREAVMGRIARVKGQPVVVPPFQAPSADELREMLADAGLPESGMETLRMGKNGGPLGRTSTVGWVYWGCTFHVAREKIHAVNARKPEGAYRGNVQGELEYYAYRDAGAYENIVERYSTCSEDRDDAGTLADRVAAGAVEQAGAPSPRFSALVRRLGALGIKAELKDDKLAFRLAEPEGKTLRLAGAVKHPWLRDRDITGIGAFEEVPECNALVEANTRAERILKSGAPECLRRETLELLEVEVREFFGALLSSERVRFHNRVLFSGRTVICPDDDLRIDQLGLAEEIAWTLFGPLVERELKKPDEVKKRTARAEKTLDEIMARSWIILNRAPTFMPTSLLAFHPVRIPEKVIRIHPLVTRLMNADFDGDQAAVFLPVTEAAQREAGEELSVVGHLRRDPELLHWMVPTFEMLWGLATLSLTSEGREEITEKFRFDVQMPAGFMTRDALEAALETVRGRDGLEKTFELLGWIMRRGFDIAKASGASLSPFIAEGLERLPRPETDDPEAWGTYAEEVCESLAAYTDFADDRLGPQVLAVKTGARGSMRQLSVLVGSRGKIGDAWGRIVPSRCGMCEGMTAQEALTCSVGARKGLAKFALQMAQEGYGLQADRQPKGFSVISRAMRAKHPGMVFARAAAREETDPLTDTDSRLFVGLPVTQR